MFAAAGRAGLLLYCFCFLCNIHQVPAAIEQCHCLFRSPELQAGFCCGWTLDEPRLLMPHLHVLINAYSRIAIKQSIILNQMLRKEPLRAATARKDRQYGNDCNAGFRTTTPSSTH